MSAQDDTFDDCPAGGEADEFHQRILSGLEDAFDELRPRWIEVEAMAPDARGEDEREFIDAMQRTREEMAQLRDDQLPYDRKYELAREVQARLLDLSLM
ncbi:hypothetical protein [Magnetofaba australis]|uniref:Uncharacterized protein n=1 Tax=Magnetofaba australis IT-1 TaxID=1434232 RepID=A0A1Y2K636_9PROT|nr:hypothetical protein [Magnetofaba australis]OSM05089.1 hypothetical protein MAIT1_03230 [Magnetofaba australis IT-1]